MGVVLAATAGLVIWIVLWSLGTKAIDGIMITALIALVAVALRSLLPTLPGYRNE